MYTGRLIFSQVIWVTKVALNTRIRKLSDRIKTIIMGL